MGAKLYVGNLDYKTTDADLEGLFEPHGTVQSAQVVTERDTGRSKGFGFVEMASAAEAQAAISALNGTQLGNRTITVSEARPKESKGGGGGGYGGGRGGHSSRERY
jgi:RNA recognition motif-containing protein